VGDGDRRGAVAASPAALWNAIRAGGGFRSHQFSSESDQCMSSHFLSPTIQRFADDLLMHPCRPEDRALGRRPFLSPSRGGGRGSRCTARSEAIPPLRMSDAGMNPARGRHALFPDAEYADHLADRSP
jgi:hypothetical protein